MSDRVDSTVAAYEGKIDLTKVHHVLSTSFGAADAHCTLED